MKALLSLILIFAFSMISKSEVITQDIEYSDGGTTFLGYLAYDNSSKEMRPGILIVHQWKGLTDYEKLRARQLAELGYVAFALDIYGKDIKPATPEETRKEVGKYYGDRNLFRERLTAGLNELKKQQFVNTNNLAVIGYCFGGSGALELARSGADIKGAVSFHGGLTSPTPLDANNIKCKISVQHGAIDPNVPDEDVAAFKKEMEDAKVDYVLTEYSGAVHSFTMESAGNDPSKGSAYNERADKRSWEAMKDFFAEIFAN